MNKNIQKTSLLLFLSVLFVLSGCSSDKKSTQTQLDEMGQKQESETKKDETEIPILSQQLRIKENAEKNIDAAVKKENAKITEALGDIDTTYAQKYSGAIIRTDMGDITVKFYNDDSPITVSNFLQLADKGLYNGTKFHRIIKNFMIQGGDPNSKDKNPADDGQGGPGYTFQDEFNDHQLVKGSLAMANSGKDTNGSQFFIVTAPSTPWLDGKHTNFGEVTTGMEIVDAIGAVETSGPPTDRPLKDISIKSVELIKK